MGKILELFLPSSISNYHANKKCASIDTKTFDLSVKNPNGGEEIVHRSPQEIMDEIAALDAESADVLAAIKQLLNAG